MVLFPDIVEDLDILALVPEAVMKDLKKQIGALGSPLVVLTDSPGKRSQAERYIETGVPLEVLTGTTQQAELVFEDLQVKWEEEAINLAATNAALKGRRAREPTVTCDVLSVIRLPGGKFTIINKGLPHELQRGFLNSLQVQQQAYRQEMPELMVVNATCVTVGDKRGVSIERFKADLKLGGEWVKKNFSDIF